MSPLRRVKLTELNAHLVCVLCSGYFVDATTIIECLHTFCKTCIVRYLHTSSFCPICDVQVHKTKPLLSLREDRTLQDVVFKLVPGLFHSETRRRHHFYKEHPEAGGDRTEQSLRERRHFFHVDDQISLSLEYLPSPPPSSSATHAQVQAHVQALKPPLKLSNGQHLKPVAKQEAGGGGGSVEQQQQEEEKSQAIALVEDKELVKEGLVKKEEEETDDKEGVNGKAVHKRYLRCPAAVQVSHLEKFIRLKYSLLPTTHRVDIMHGEDCLMGELTLLDVVYMYKWTEDAPLRLLYTVTAIPQSRKRPRINGTRAITAADSEAPLPKLPRTQAPQEVSQTPPAGSSVMQVPAKPPCVQEQGGDEPMETEADVKEVPKTDAEKKAVAAPSCAPASVSAATPPQQVTVVATTSSAAKPQAAQVVGAALTSAPVASRGRPAVTTTTPATTTPRVALPHPPKALHAASSASPGAAPVPAVASAGLNTTTAASPGAAAPVPGRAQAARPLVNGIADAATKPQPPPAQPNKVPQPIIPTRPRLGRPPNASRIAAVNMKPPGPRLGEARHPRPPAPSAKMVPQPPAGAGRGSPTVSASLSVQSRLISISGPPVRPHTAKVSVKRPGDGRASEAGAAPQEGPAT
ncbi:polycomb group protein Psc-like, partial [Penaeus monodon]|uniref:polycomb group protein Psc-like n=1 Tax=Penaeus monodon TaxID=6687 RepID=UPI0018A72F11